MNAASPRAAVGLLLASEPGHANYIALQYLNALIARGLATATIARRIAALKSIVRLARKLGRIVWALDVDTPRVTPYRNTAGPGREAWRRMRDVATARTDPKGMRDLAIIRLLHDLALRRAEPMSLDLASIDFEEVPGGLLPPQPIAIHAITKGSLDRLRLELPAETALALAGWLAVRGSTPGPLFHRLDRAGTGGRLTLVAVNQIVGRIAAAAGVPLGRGSHPHGLRHTAITDALDKTGGDVRRVQRFSRHAKIETVIRYDDARTNPSLDIARLVAGD